MRNIGLLVVLLSISEISVGQLQIQAISVNTTCQTVHGHNLDGNNIGTGRINATAKGGKSPYTFSISGKNTKTRTQNNGYFPQLYATTYLVSVIDANGITKDTSIAISSTLPIPTINFPIINNPSGCDSSDGQIQIGTLTGTPPFWYSIDGGADYSKDSIFKNLSPGEYYCDVKDANGCLSFSWIGFIMPTSSNCNFVGGQNIVLTSCNNDADQVVVNVRTLKDSAFKISFDSIHYHVPNQGYYVANGYINGSDTLSNLGEGVHIVYVLDTLTGERAKTNITVGKSCTLYIKFINIDASCQQSDGALTINATGGTLPYQYSLDGINF